MKFTSPNNEMAWRSTKYRIVRKWLCQQSFTVRRQRHQTRTVDILKTHMHVHTRTHTSKPMCTKVRIVLCSFFPVLIGAFQIDYTHKYVSYPYMILIYIVFQVILFLFAMRKTQSSNSFKR